MLEGLYERSKKLFGLYEKAQRRLLENLPPNIDPIEFSLKSSTAEESRSSISSTLLLIVHFAGTFCCFVARW